ncbi:MAG TPA: ABC transporter ATP-binding protein [Candidatus Scybalocola faecigallinarum]|uniref:ABC transporter ATP-binding protein n=1 Tax=Candidatus Scybalocola faecigallinarum TaxID=2840941 RepID=A0A9D1F576_9FIRM|nr:ABC transporter ATP-binding protein [Candidatus Scybalocola faecigallinarum]
MNVIEIENLTFSYPGAKIPTLKNISLTVEQGDFLAIVGNNGCGKSTLCKAMNGLIPNFITGEFQGKVLAGGLDTQKTDVGTLACKVGYVYQDFENQIVRPTVLDDASYACMNYAMKDYLDRGRDALKKCGLEGRENDYIWQLSGGQTHLLALAGAVSLQPDVLILDEPIAQLDPGHADRIYEVLKDLNENYGKTIIVIEHHTEYIADYCKHVLLLKDGNVAWKLPADEALRHVKDLTACNIFPPQVTRAAYALKQRHVLPLTTSLPTTVAQGMEIFKALANESALTNEKVLANESTLSEEKGKAADTAASVAVGAAPCQADAQAAVEFQDLSLSYRSVKGKPHTVFDHLNLTVRKGEKIALIGSNGAGKSTLMKLMIGLLKAGSGQVSVFGQPVRSIKRDALSRLVSLVYQNPEEMFIKDSIEADIAYAMKVRGISRWEERTKELLEQFRLTELKDRDGRLLSGGQMRRASLAIGIALNPQILLLDEPTANLDIATRREILTTLEAMKDMTDTVMIATHDMQLVCEWAQRIIVLYQGTVIADGTRDEIFGNARVRQLTGIRPPEIFDMGQALDPDAYCYTIDAFVDRFGGMENVWNDQKAFG